MCYSCFLLGRSSEGCGKRRCLSVTALSYVPSPGKSMERFGWSTAGPFLYSRGEQKKERRNVSLFPVPHKDKRTVGKSCKRRCLLQEVRLRRFAGSSGFQRLSCISFQFPFSCLRDPSGVSICFSCLLRSSLLFYAPTRRWSCQRLLQ